MTLIEHYTQLFHRKYVYPTDKNKNEEFFVKMNKHFEELCEIDKTRNKKVKEIEEYLESIDFHYGDVDFQEEIEYEESLQEVKVDGKKLKFGRKFGMPTKTEFFYNYEKFDTTIRDKTEKRLEEKDWYVTFFDVNEGWMKLEIDEEFDQSKLVFDLSNMKYGDEYFHDEDLQPNSDVSIWCEYENDDTDTRFSHDW